jgi:hypothetical protein
VVNAVALGGDHHLQLRARPDHDHDDADRQGRQHTGPEIVIDGGGKVTLSPVRVSGGSST